MLSRNHYNTYFLVKVDKVLLHCFLPLLQDKGHHLMLLLMEGRGLELMASHNFPHLLLLLLHSAMDVHSERNHNTS